MHYFAQAPATDSGHQRNGPGGIHEVFDLDKIRESLHHKADTGSMPPFEA